MSQYPNSENNPDFHQDELTLAKEVNRTGGRLNPSDQTSKPAGKISPSEKTSSRYLHPEYFINDINSRYK